MGILFPSQSCRTAPFVQLCKRYFMDFISYAPFFSEFTVFDSFLSLLRRDALQVVPLRVAMCPLQRNPTQ